MLGYKSITGRDGTVGGRVRYALLYEGEERKCAWRTGYMGASPAGQSVRAHVRLHVTA